MGTRWAPLITAAVTPAVPPPSPALESVLSLLLPLDCAESRSCRPVLEVELVAAAGVAAAGGAEVMTVVYAMLYLLCTYMSTSKKPHGTAFSQSDSACGPIRRPCRSYLLL